MHIKKSKLISLSNIKKTSHPFSKMSDALLSWWYREESQIKVIGKDLCVCSQRVYSCFDGEKYAEKLDLIPKNISNAHGSPFEGKKLGHGSDGCVGKLLRSFHHHNATYFYFPLFASCFMLFHGPMLKKDESLCRNFFCFKKQKPSNNHRRHLQ